MSDKIETPAAGAAAGTNEATAAAADTKTTAAELKAAKKELGESVKRVAALEGENTRLSEALKELQNSYSELSKHALGLEAKVDALKLENEALQAIPKAEDNRILYTAANGETYEVVNPTFLYKGSNHNAADLIESGDTEVFEELIAAKAFILKKV